MIKPHPYILLEPWQSRALVDKRLSALLVPMDPQPVRWPPQKGSLDAIFVDCPHQPGDLLAGKEAWCGDPEQGLVWYWADQLKTQDDDESVDCQSPESLPDKYVRHRLRVKRIEPINIHPGKPWAWYIEIERQPKP